MKGRLIALSVLFALGGCQKNASEPLPNVAPKMAEATGDEAAEVSEESEPEQPAIELKRNARVKRPKSKKIAPGKREIMAMPDARPVEADTEDFKNYGVNPWVDTTVDKLSTFSIDVDTGAYTIARKKLVEQKALPPKDSVRVEEYVNYFKYNYPNPGETFGVYLESAPSPFSQKPDQYLLRVGVQGKRLEAKERKPIHLTFLVDVSGSMNNADKLPLAVEALKVLVNNLKPGDTVALVTYAGYVAEVLKPTGSENRGAIFEALDSLGAGGGTGMNSGMEIAYKLAMSQKKPGEVSRVIVLSDGDANIGPMSHDDILKGIEGYVAEGVTLSTIGLGMGNYKDTTMEQLANKGNGNYFYIDSIKEARKVFGEQLDGTLQVIAKDVKIQVEFDPDKVSGYRLIGYENRNIADKDFRNDKVDAGEIGAGHTVTALYELRVKGKPAGKMATVRVRHKLPEAIKATEQAFDLTDAEFKAKIGETSQDFQFAASVATFAELLRESPHVEGVNLDWVKEVAAGAAAPGQADRQEFLKLVDAAKSLRP